MTGIIFDFNGTMFQDSDLHEAAWITMLKKYSDRQLTEEDILKNLHGKINPVVLRHFLSDQLTDQEVEKLSDEKEAIYRQMVRDSPDHQQMTQGMVATLDALKEQKIPMTIASASRRRNMDFYFDLFDLNRWFDPEKVVVDNGTFPGKPAPDIFLIAAEKIGVSPADAIVIEDSYSGIQSAENAKIGKIIAIDPLGKNREQFAKEQLRIDGIIEDFDGFVEKYI